jgi:hypothetical protein
MDFAFNLCGALDELRCGEDALKYFDETVSDVVAGAGLGVGSAAEAVISVFI